MIWSAGITEPLPHNADYVVFFCLHNKTQAFNPAVVFYTGGHDIDPGGIDAAVAQNLCNS